MRICADCRKKLQACCSRHSLLPCQTSICVMAGEAGDRAWGMGQKVVSAKPMLEQFCEKVQGGVSFQRPCFDSSIWTYRHRSISDLAGSPAGLRCFTASRFHLWHLTPSDQRPCWFIASLRCFLASRFNRWRLILRSPVLACMAISREKPIDQRPCWCTAGLQCFTNSRFNC